MRRARSRVVAWVGAAAVAVAGAALGPVVATAAQAAPAESRPEGKIAWGACEDVNLLTAGAECAMLPVPLDWAKPDGKSIWLALSRVKATGNRQGVMLTNPGGPGGSGRWMPTYLPGAVPREVGLTYDWIGFDPRGVGASRPALSCEPDYLKGPRPAYRPAEKTGRAPNERAWISRTKAYAKACAVRNGDLLRHVRTADTVKDMDAIRAALGEERINFYGMSYGTFLGQTYATAYPGRVRRMVLDGNVPPDYSGYGDGGRAQMTSFQFVIREFFAWMARYDSTYHLGTTADEVAAAYGELQAKLGAQPVGEVGAAELDDVFLRAGYAERLWPTVADAFADARMGDTSALERQYRQANSPGDDNAFAAFNATFCTDGPFPTDYAKVRQDGYDIAEIAPLPAWGGFWFSAPCTWWPVEPGKPLVVDGQRLAATDTRILLINATRDGATPFSGALAVRKEFPTAVLVAEQGATTHSGSLSGNACIDKYVADYLADGTLPRRLSGNRSDADCARTPVPKPANLNRAVPVAPQGVPLPLVNLLSTGADRAPVVGRESR
ncbi:MAG: alpha/beta hydrolase [Sporichthyaceae bacterium]